MDYRARASSLNEIAQRITDWATKYGGQDDKVYCVEVEKAEKLRDRLIKIQEELDEQVSYADKEIISKTASDIFDNAVTEIKFGLNYKVLKESAAREMAKSLAAVSSRLNNLADDIDRS